MSSFKPMLASVVEIADVKFPVLASAKIDGIRCIIHPDLGPVTRKLKPIPNLHIRKLLAQAGLLGMDGELVTYTDGNIGPDDFNTVQSKVMSAEGTPVFQFEVFDNMLFPADAYHDRLTRFRVIIDEIVNLEGGSCAKPVSTLKFSNVTALSAYEKMMVADGWEGIMVRDPNGRYKHGRSTVNEGLLLKVVRKFRDEAVVIGYDERMHNTNTLETDNLGYAKRSTAKAGKVPMGMLGGLKLKWRDNTFDLATGFTDEQRKELWANPDALIGRKVTFEYREIGPNGRPRFPVFIGFRHDDDII